MANLKFDRSVSMALEKEEVVTVPIDEVWRGTATPSLKVNGSVLGPTTGSNPGVAMLGGGCDA